MIHDEVELIIVVTRAAAADSDLWYQGGSKEGSC
jgi:hypothetical protein